MIVQREMLSWLKRYLPHPHEVVLEENPTADRPVLLIWFHQLCPLMLLSYKSRLICTLLTQTLWYRFPLRIRAGTGSPVRAVAVLED